MPSTKIIDRLLRVRCRYTKQNKPAPKTLRVKKARVERLINETMQYMSPSEIAGITILGMRIIEV